MQELYDTLDYKMVIAIVLYDNFGSEVVYGTNITGDYRPGDTNSICNCIVDISNKAKGIKETVKSITDFINIQGYGIRIQFVRPNKSIVDEIDINNNEIELVSEIRNKFQLT